MPAFKSKLIIEDAGGLPFLLYESLVYETGVWPGEIVVPKGFKTDFASIPRGLWNILPPIGSYDKAAVLHDFLYQTNGVTRKQADDVLLEAMTVSGTSKWVRWAIYSGVRIGGWVVWNRYRAMQHV